MSARETTISNESLSLTVDEMGRLVSLKNLETGTEFITHAQAAEGWRIVAPAGRYRLAITHASEQKDAPTIAVEQSEGGRRLTISYERIWFDDDNKLRINQENRYLDVRAKFVLTMPDDASEVSATIELDNRSECAVDEVEFPVLAGMGGLGEKKDFTLFEYGSYAVKCEDIIENGLPNTGEESDHYGRAVQTCMFPTMRLVGAEGHHTTDRGVWQDLYGEEEGIYFGYHCPEMTRFAAKFEHFPKEHTNWPSQHDTPPDHPRYISYWGLHMPRLQPGEQWSSPPVVVMPHRGRWHAGAERFSAYYRSVGYGICKSPSWMENFTGWTILLGNTYIGEIYHDYKSCADEMIKDAEVTGLKTVFYYGHTKLGAEGADFDWGPADELGGDEGFRKMVVRLHAAGLRIILLDHLHRYVNSEIPEFTDLNLAKYQVVERNGLPVRPRWWKETGLSCLYREGPTPAWAEMCPYCEEWQDIYLDHLDQMIELGVDGLELDCFSPTFCHAKGHGHEPGACTEGRQLELLKRIRGHVEERQPEFAIILETDRVFTRQYADGWLYRLVSEEKDKALRFMFPEVHNLVAMIGNYAYDRVNYTLQLGVGIDVQVSGIRATALRACPELAEYIGEVNRFKLKHADIFLGGTFRDVLGAAVQAEDLQYSVLLGEDGRKALVLRNNSGEPQEIEAGFEEAREDKRLVLWRPFAGEKAVASQPVKLTLQNHEVAAILQV